MPVLYPMRHTTAMGVGTLAVALSGLLKGERKLAATAAGIATFIAVLAFGAQIFRWSRPDLIRDDPFAGAVAGLIHTAFPNTIAFFIAGTAVLALCARRESVHRWVWTSVAERSL